MANKSHKKTKLRALLARSQSKKSTQGSAAGSSIVSTCSANPSQGPVSHRDSALVPFHYYARLGFYSPVPVSLYSRVLLVGEGNFSFAYSLLSYLSESRASFTRAVPPSDMHSAFYFLATCYEPENELYAKYPESRQYVADIRSLGGHVLFEVDATALDKDKRLSQGKPFSRIIFNFPHTGKGIKDQDRNIAHHQQFLKEFFLSATLLLSSFSLTANGQKGKKKPISSCAANDYFKPIRNHGPRLSDACNLSYRTVYLIPQESNVLLPKTRVSRPGRRKRQHRSPHLASSSEGEPGSESEGDDTAYPTSCRSGDSVSDADESSFFYMNLKEHPEIHVTLKSGLPYSQWNIKRIAHSLEVPLECRETFSFVRAKYACYAHVNTIGHFKSKMERQLEMEGQDVISDLSSPSDLDAVCKERLLPSHVEMDHLKGKECKTFVFVLADEKMDSDKTRAPSDKKSKFHTLKS